MAVKHYFHIQKLTFSLCGIDTEAIRWETIVRRPLLCYVPLLFATAHVVAMIHYAYTNRHEYAEATDSLTLSCQSLLAIWKMVIFLSKRKEFVDLIRDIHLVNFKAGSHELPIIAVENKKDVKFCAMYFRIVLASAILAFMSPILEALYIFSKTGNLVLRVPYKASYPWNHSQLPGYSLVYLWNALSIYNLFGISLAIDTLFTWLVSNISAQFHILCWRFKEATATFSDGLKDTEGMFKCIKSCIQHHEETVEMAARLNQVYSEIIFIKFLISCSQICCLVYCLICPIKSAAVAAYQCMFLLSVVMQLMLYCYNGQRIRDEFLFSHMNTVSFFLLTFNLQSLQVAAQIYFAFGFSNMTATCKKLLILPMMRSQKSSQLKGVFFVLDLKLFLWAFKTAGSLITALKTLDEKFNI